MLKAGLRFPFSPSAVQALLQTSVMQVRNGTTGAAMSLIDKTDVKNHLSARYRTQIHLTPPASQPDATGIPHEESASAEAKASSSVQSPLNVPVPNEAETSPITLSKTPQA